MRKRKKNRSRKIKQKVLIRATFTDSGIRPGDVCYFGGIKAVAMKVIHFNNLSEVTFEEKKKK